MKYYFMTVKLRETHLQERVFEGATGGFALLEYTRQNTRPTFNPLD